MAAGGKIEGRAEYRKMIYFWPAATPLRSPQWAFRFACVECSVRAGNDFTSQACGSGPGTHSRSPCCSQNGWPPHSRSLPSPASKPKQNLTTETPSLFAILARVALAPAHGVSSRKALLTHPGVLWSSLFLGKLKCAGKWWFLQWDY